MQWEYAPPVFQGKENKALKFKLPGSCRLFLLLAVIQYAVSGVLRCSNFFQSLQEAEEADESDSPHLVIAAVWIFVTLMLLDTFILVFAYRTLSQSNLFDLGYFLIFSLCSEANQIAYWLRPNYAANSWLARNWVLYSDIAVETAVRLLIFVLCARSVWPNIRWLFFKRIGGDPAMRKLYRAWLFWHSAWLVDVVCSSMFAMTVFFASWNNDDIVCILVTLTMSMQLAWAIAGRKAISSQSRGLLQSFLALSPVTPVLFTVLIWLSTTGPSASVVAVDYKKFHFNVTEGASAELVVDELHALVVTVAFGVFLLVSRFFLVRSSFFLRRYFGTEDGWLEDISNDFFVFTPRQICPRLYGSNVALSRDIRTRSGTILVNASDVGGSDHRRESSTSAYEYVEDESYVAMR